MLERLGITQYRIMKRDQSLMLGQNAAIIRVLTVTCINQSKDQSEREKCQQ